MDHGGDHGGKKRRMWMWFHTVTNDTLLFQDWWIQDTKTMIWSCVVIFVLAIVLEALRWLRWVAHVRRMEEKTWCSHLLNTSHYVDTLLFFAHCVLAYVLMLAFMTFSLWLCLSLCLGLAVGYYIFGTKRFKICE
ncbi:unnamed protein product [Cylicocyclus nassatus]|uniref:Copper transport protein n=1 Tax=Cylicocyclus nassatus TaxID=53992 RepID=A0AA36H0D2_CYLNA|nr:unnamed protein product [Cylicocyclus nassatus]